MAVDPELFKQGLRRWASGVTVVTTKSGDKPHGMTVSAFSSVSADPPLVLVCANRNSRTHAVIREGGRFTVNVLASDQQDVSAVFSSSKLEDSRFDHVAWRPGLGGVPLIDGALVNLECRVEHSHDHGSHTIYIGYVDVAHVADKRPLLYYDGAYRDVG